MVYQHAFLTSDFNSNPDLKTNHFSLFNANLASSRVPTFR